jgi:hypothetical protein
MKKRTLWLLGGAAVGVYALYRYNKKSGGALSGMRGLGSAESDWSLHYDQVRAVFDKLGRDIQSLPDNLRLSYEGNLYGDIGIGKQLDLSRDLAQDQGEYKSAEILLGAASKNLSRIAPMIASDLKDRTGEKSEDIVAARLNEITRVQAANEADRKLAEKGATAWIVGKTAEAAGSAASQIASAAGAGLWGFMKKIPWWVYGIGIAGAGIYFFGPAIKRRISNKIAGAQDRVAGGPAPVAVQQNPRRRRASRRRR